MDSSTSAATISSNKTNTLGPAVTVIIAVAVDFYTTKPATKFYKFSHLPKELRLKIWRFTFPASRTIRIFEGIELEKRFDPTLPIPWKWAPHSIPISLSINHEARTETLRTYKLAFATAGSPKKIYFDFDRDVLAFAEFGPAMQVQNFAEDESISRADIRSIQKMQFSIHQLLFSCGCADEPLMFLNNFTGMKQLSVTRTLVRNKSGKLVAQKDHKSIHSVDDLFDEWRGLTWNDLREDVETVWSLSDAFGDKPPVLIWRNQKKIDIDAWFDDNTWLGLPPNFSPTCSCHVLCYHP
jgi:hypothetical protein